MIYFDDMILLTKGKEELKKDEKIKMKRSRKHIIKKKFNYKQREIERNNNFDCLLKRTNERGENEDGKKT